MTGFTTFMPLARAQARLAAARGEIPVGAVITRKGRVIAQAGNRTRALRDPTAHAEILAIRAACQALDTDRLMGCDLWVTLEPCAACAGAIAAARIARLYYGASDPKSGGVECGPRVFDHPQAHWAPEIYSGLEARECAALLTTFFADKRRP
jgi:cytidine deaminase